MASNWRIGRGRFLMPQNNRQREMRPRAMCIDGTLSQTRIYETRRAEKYARNRTIATPLPGRPTSRPRGRAPSRGRSVGRGNIYIVFVGSNRLYVRGAQKSPHARTETVADYPRLPAACRRLYIRRVVAHRSIRNVGNSAKFGRCVRTPSKTNRRSHR